MNKLTITFCLLLIVGNMTFAQNKQPDAAPNKKFTPQQLKEDLEFLIKTYENVHVDLYAYITKEKIASERKKIAQQLNKPLTKLEFYRILAPLASLFQDGHTSIPRPNDLFSDYLNKGGLLLPFRVKITDDFRVFVRQNMDSKEPIPIGSELLSINGKPVNKIAQKLITYYSGEMIQYRKKNAQGGFIADLWPVFGFNGNFKIVYKEKSIGKKLTLKHPGLNLEQWKKRSAELRKTKPTFVPFAYRKYSPKIGLFTINTFDGRKQKEFDNFLRANFAKIQSQNITHLIIDVRANGGGNSALGDALLDYITNKPWIQFAKSELKISKEIKDYQGFKNDQRVQKAKSGAIITNSGEFKKPTQNKPLRFKGKTYVLSGLSTFSSGSSFVAAIKEYNISTIVGNQTGGVAASFGELYSFKLPHTQLKAHSSCKRFVVCPNCEKPNRGIPADYKVIDTKPNDGKDEVLEYTLQLIKKDQSK